MIAARLIFIVWSNAWRIRRGCCRVYIIDTPQPNAFATGRDPDHAAVAATTGLLRNLTPEELAGVMAHEFAHIQNRDTLIMTITATLAGALSALANFALWFGNRRNMVATLALNDPGPVGRQPGATGHQPCAGVCGR